MKLQFKNWVLCGSVACMSLFQSCSEDNIGEIENDQINQINATAVYDQELTSFEKKQQKFDYFMQKYQNGEDITTELYNYVEATPAEEFDGALDYESNKGLILNAIDPDRYTCDTSDSKMSAYLSESLKDWTFLDIILYMTNGFYPQVYSFYFATDSKDNEYGYNGEFTNVANETFKDLKRFWEIDGEGIAMVPMKGSIYRDKELMTEIHQTLFDVPLANSESRAQKLYDWFTAPQWWNADHPILSANAVAIQGTNPISGEPLRKIVLGDGLLNTMDAIGYGDIATQAILAHEYAHHIQYAYDLIDRDADLEDRPNATRDAELMADALAAYYLTHKKGGTINWWRLEQLINVQSEIGDCSFTSSGHHGTPNQRVAAAKWAYELADSAHKQGHTLSSMEVVELYRDNYENILECDNCLTE